MSCCLASNATGISSGIYIGTIIGALPQMWLMKRFTTSKYIAVNVFMWGLLTMVSPFSNYTIM